MPTATTTREDSLSKMAQNHPHDFTKRLFILWMFSFLSFISLLHLGPTEDSVLITELTAIVSLVGMMDWMARGTPPI
jgi:hypothetical protein